MTASSLFLFCEIFGWNHLLQVHYFDEMILSFRWLDCIYHTSSYCGNELELFLLRLKGTYNGFVLKIYPLPSVYLCHGQPCPCTHMEIASPSLSSEVLLKDAVLLSTLDPHCHFVHFPSRQRTTVQKMFSSFPANAICSVVIL